MSIAASVPSLRKQQIDGQKNGEEIEKEGDGGEEHKSL